MARSIETTHRGFSNSNPDARQLALEVRSQRWAFVVFQGSTLLDLGVRNVPQRPSEKRAGIRRLVFLLQLYVPSVVVVRRTRRTREESSKRAAQTFVRIREEIERRSIPFISLDRTHVRNVFASLGCRTKHEIAATVAERFPELRPRLPRPRKPWDKERKRVAIFDAIATAIAFNELRESEST